MASEVAECLLLRNYSEIRSFVLLCKGLLEAGSSSQYSPLFSVSLLEHASFNGLFTPISSSLILTRRTLTPPDDLFLESGLESGFSPKSPLDTISSVCFKSAKMGD